MNSEIWTCERCKKNEPKINGCINVPPMFFIITAEGVKEYHAECYGLDRIKEIFDGKLESERQTKRIEDTVYVYVPSWAERKKALEEEMARK